MVLYFLILIILTKNVVIIASLYWTSNDKIKISLQKIALILILTHIHTHGMLLRIPYNKKTEPDMDIVVILDSACRRMKFHYWVQFANVLRMHLMKIFVTVRNIFLIVWLRALLTQSRNKNARKGFRPLSALYVGTLGFLVLRSFKPLLT